jgi:hypothetical protein
MDTVRVMANPARELLAFFTNWRSKGAQAPLIFRGYDTLQPDQIASELRRGARLLAEIEGAIDDLQARGHNVDLYRRAMVRWTFGVFSYDSGWAQQTDPRAHLYTEHTMDNLEALANEIDNTLGVTNADTLAKVQALVDEATALLIEDGSISEQLRYYLSQLLQEIRHVAIDEQMINSFNMRSALERLWVAFYGAAAQSKEPSRWTKLADKLVWPAAAGLLGSLPGLTVTALQITQGVS